MITLAGLALVPDLSGALFRPDTASLLVADLHLEKGTALAARGRLLPPYDTVATLRALAGAIARHRPQRVICLGDNFHDIGGPARLAEADRARLAALTQDREWVWITGNHDPALPADIGGSCLAALKEGPLTYRHAAEPGASGEISGHYHPKAVLRTPRAILRGRCFIADDARLVLPSFGAFTGGLDIADPALAGLFRGPRRGVLIGRRKLHPFHLGPAHGR